MKQNFCRCIIAFLLCILFIGCSQDEPVTDISNSGFVEATPGSYDSMDTAVLVSKNNDETLTFMNIETGKRYTLSYTGATTMWDKYGEAISMAQLTEGDIVDVKFLKGKKKLADIALHTEAFTYTDVTKYEINELTRTFTIVKEAFQYSKDAVIVSDGREIELMDLNEADVLSIQGIGSTIYSIAVDKGHGYLKLANDEYFIGGWIEIGTSMIRPITDDMLLVVPEGKYEVLFTNKGNSGVKKVTIGRDEEVTVDIGDFEIKEIQYGNVIFTMNPTDALLYIDGKLVDTSAAISLEYGIHQLIAVAAGYDTLTQYIKVGQESAGVSITLEKESADEDEKDEEKDEDEDEKETVDISSSYKVYIDTPEGVEVYLNGNYIGISPVSFAKKPGTHTITLRKNGYVTRSYTIEIDREEKDVTYSFADLLESDTGTPKSAESEESTEKKQKQRKVRSEKAIYL
ncbi:MAG: PEGA domain-containing protein [Lachnospiraceae bacterium]|nr:PEGA domain-containing protein [Lachnospiraceae bacterium]